MNTIRICLSLYFILVLGGCSKELQLSPGQLTDVNEMKSDFQAVKIYNDSLIMCFTDSITYPGSMKQFYDSMYHHFDSLFTQCHNNYEHNNSAADHSHNGQGMAVMLSSHGGNMMDDGECPCCDNGGHSVDMHDQMDVLHQRHIPYHPY